ncbi:MAG: hypothetical protein U0V04_17490 [Spirosomataceae bacterium]
MKNLFSITFYFVLTLYIILVNFDITNRQLFTTMSLIPILSLWFFAENEYPKNVKFWMTLVFTFMFIGFSTGQLITREEDFIAKNTIFDIAEFLFLMPVVFHLGLNQQKNITHEVLKFVIVAAISLLFILLFFELFSFPEQIVVFIRILQLGLFFGWTWRNPKIHSNVYISLFVLVLANILFILLYARILNFNEELFVTPTFFISKYLLVSGLINSFQRI